MILKPIGEIWQPCAGDTKDGICIPFLDPDTIKIYAHGEVTDINVIECDTGTSTNIPIGDWNYVIATDPNGDTYTYLTEPTLPGGLGTCFYFEVTFGGVQYYTPCYQDIADNSCRMRDTVWIESDFAGFDCLGRWYGAPTPQSIIAGNNSLSFNNGMLFWGTLSTLPTDYEFTNFDTCTVTKTKAVTSYEVEALSIAPYFVEMIEAILGRGVIYLDAGNATQYAVKPGTHFEKIRAFCRSQYDMKLNLTDCACEIYHECDLGYDFVPVLDCESALNYHCETLEVECMQMFPCMATVERVPGGMEFTFTDPTLGGNDVVRAAELETLLTGCVASNYALQILTLTNQYYFYSPFISNVVQASNVVTFDYSDFFTPPVTFDCELNFITADNWAVYETQTIDDNYQICCYAADLVFELTVSGSPLINAIWSANVPFTQIDVTHISVPMPTGGDITVTVDVFPELCGEVTLTATVNDNPTYEGRFMAAHMTAVLVTPTTLRLTEASYYLNTSLLSLEWVVYPFDLLSPYSTTSLTASPLTISGMSADDDFLIELRTTDIYGNISRNFAVFGQNSPAAPDENFYMGAKVNLAAFSGTQVTITPDYYLPIDTYTYPIVPDVLGLDADMDNTYEQTTPAALPVPFVHDYGGTGIFLGRVGVDILASVPPPPGANTYAALPLGTLRCQYVVQIV